MSNPNSLFPVGSYLVTDISSPVPVPAGDPVAARVALNVVLGADGEGDFDEHNFKSRLSEQLSIPLSEIKLAIDDAPGGVLLHVELPATAGEAFFHLAGKTFQTPPVENRPRRYTDDLSGQVIRDYQLRERIAKGGFGAIYQAYQASVGREVAIKIILPEYANQPEFIKRFEAEAHVIARLEHINIVPMYDYWRDETGAYLVMRLLRGGSLRTKLQNGVFEARDVSRILQQIAAALTLAHKRGIVHRDIKPDNILLDETGNAYLSDFGIAKDLGVSTHDSKEGALVGTPYYFAPEQFKGSRITALTDQYSLGLVLYELLTGERPFNNLSLAELLYKHLNEPLPPLSLRRLDLPVSLNEVIQRATAKDPANRYADVQALAHAFDRAALMSLDTEEATPAISVTPPPVSSVVYGSLKARHYERAELIVEKPLRLIGRESLLTEIRQLLDENERVLLHGLGGMGKTSLAATVAAGYIEAGKGSVIWLEASNEPADALFDALGRALGEQHSLMGKFDDVRIQAVRALLIDKKSLLVVDNVWNDRALFEFMKAVPPSMPALITSRHAVPIEGLVLDVDELPPDDALALMAYHARKDLRSDEAAQALCAKLGNHPFALEIAGKRLKVNRQMTPAQLMESIDAAPHNLSMPGNFADAGRAGIRDLLDASIDELSVDLRKVFVMMGGMFVPRTSLELFKLVIDQNDETTRRQMDNLQQRGLVDVEPAADETPAHYRLHDLTYSYARALFKDEISTRQAVSKATREFVTEHATDFDLLEFDLNNILGAAREAARSEDTGTLLGLMTVLATKGYMDARGHSLLLLQRLDDAIGAARYLGASHAELLHYLLGKRGNAYRDRGDLDNAFGTYKEALELAPNPTRKAILLSVIGTVRAWQKAADANDYLQQAYETAKTNQDDLALSFVLEHRGHYAVSLSDYETARRFFAEGVDVAERLQDSVRLLNFLLNLGAREHELGLYNEALSHHQRAEAIAVESGNVLWIANAMHSTGEDFHALEDREKAGHYLVEAYHLYQKFGATSKAAEIMHFLDQEKYPLPQ